MIDAETLQPPTPAGGASLTAILCFNFNQPPPIGLRRPASAAGLDDQSNYRQVELDCRRDYFRVASAKTGGNWPESRRWSAPVKIDSSQPAKRCIALPKKAVGARSRFGLAPPQIGKEGAHATNCV